MPTITTIMVRSRGQGRRPVPLGAESHPQEVSLEATPCFSNLESERPPAGPQLESLSRTRLGSGPLQETPSKGRCLPVQEVSPDKAVYAHRVHTVLKASPRHLTWLSWPPPGSQCPPIRHECTQGSLPRADAASGPACWPHRNLLPTCGCAMGRGAQGHGSTYLLIDEWDSWSDRLQEGLHRVWRVGEKPTSRALSCEKELSVLLLGGWGPSVVIGPSWHPGEGVTAQALLWQVEVGSGSWAALYSWGLYLCLPGHCIHLPNIVAGHLQTKPHLPHHLPLNV
jgi:hypothetical protein